MSKPHFTPSSAEVYVPPTPRPAEQRVTIQQQPADWSWAAGPCWVAAILGGLSLFVFMTQIDNLRMVEIHGDNPPAVWYKAADGAEYVTFGEFATYRLVDGKLVEVPRPYPDHQAGR